MLRAGLRVLFRPSLYRTERHLASPRSASMTAAPLDVEKLRGVKALIGVVQLTSTPDKQATLAQLTALVERAQLKGAKVVHAITFAIINIAIIAI